MNEPSHAEMRDTIQTLHEEYGDTWIPLNRRSFMLVVGVADVGVSGAARIFAELLRHHYVEERVIDLHVNIRFTDKARAVIERQACPAP